MLSSDQLLNFPKFPRLGVRQNIRSFREYHPTIAENLGHNARHRKSCFFGLNVQLLAHKLKTIVQARRRILDSTFFSFAFSRFDCFSPIP